MSHGASEENAAPFTPSGVEVGSFWGGTQVSSLIEAFGKGLVAWVSVWLGLPLPVDQPKCRPRTWHGQGRSLCRGYRGRSWPLCFWVEKAARLPGPAGFSAPRGRDLGAWPNRHIAALAQAFIVRLPVCDATPILLDLVTLRVIEFMRHQRGPLDQQCSVLTELAGAVQQGRVDLSLGALPLFWAVAWRCARQVLSGALACFASPQPCPSVQRNRHAKDRTGCNKTVFGLGSMWGARSPIL
jgi:hypothetical protein